MLDALRRAGARAVEQDGERVRAWLPPPSDVRRAVADVERGLRASTSMADPRVEWDLRSHEAWLARWAAEAAPIRVVPGIVVMGPDTADPGAADAGNGVDGDDVVIRLEPGVAFGNAEHPTTRGCLRLLRDEIVSGAVVCDVGSGTGILAVAAALLGARQVLALETDPLAADAARRNVQLNGLADVVTVRRAAVGPADAGALAPVDLVLANLEAPLLTALLPGFSDAIGESGGVIVAGVTGGEESSFRDDVVNAGLRVHRSGREDGWWCAVLRRSGQQPRR